MERSRSSLILAALMASAGGWSFGAAFTFARVVPILAVGTVIGTLGAYGVSRRPRAWPWVVVTGAGVAISSGAVGAMLLTQGQPRASLGTLVLGAMGPITGWSHILSTTLPAPAVADCLGAATSTIAVGVFAAAYLAGWRQRTLAIVPAFCMAAAGLSIGVGGAGGIVETTVPLVVATSLYLIAVPGQSHRLSAVSITQALLVTGLGGAIVLASGRSLPLASVRHPVDPRQRFQQSVNLGDVASPLDVFAAPRPDQVVFSASVDQVWLSHPPVWRLASFDHFDGQSWSQAEGFKRSGDIISSTALGPLTRTVLSIKHLDGPWIPTTGVLSGLQPEGMAYDAAMDTAADPSPRQVRTYELAAIVAQPDSAALLTASVPTGKATSALSVVPSCIPAKMRELATGAEAQGSRPALVAVAIERLLAESASFHLDPNAPGGSSCGALDAFMASGVGTASQFAQSYVLLARLAGLPSRLVIGFRPGEIDVRAHRATVRETDVLVWPEVELTGTGWIAFDPLPRTASIPAPQSPPALQAIRQTDRRTPGAALPKMPSTNAPTLKPPHTAHRSRWVIPSAAVIALALVLGVLVRKRLAKLWRRRVRRRRRDSVSRTLGAWQEVVELLADQRLAGPAMTPAEIAAGLPGSSDTRSAVTELGKLVDLTVYGPNTPTDADAQGAWILAKRARKAMPRRIGRSRSSRS